MGQYNTCIIHTLFYLQKNEAPKHLLGTIVMTTYNEKTYRVDDIDWDCNPRSSFPYKGGECTYLDYYEKVRLEGTSFILAFLHLILQSSF